MAQTLYVVSGPALGGYPVADALTAHAGGGQASALALTSVINRGTTVSTVLDSFALPTSTAGMSCTLINSGTKSCQVFGAGTDTINDVATATGVTQPPNSVQTYFCSVAGKWYSQSMGSTFAEGAGFVGITGLVTADGALAVAPAFLVVTKAGVAAMTLAAPTTITHDGMTIQIVSNTANAHTLTATGLIQAGGAGADVATFANVAGAGLKLMAYGAKWKVLSQMGITFS